MKGPARRVALGDKLVDDGIDVALNETDGARSDLPGLRLPIRTNRS